MCVIGVGANPFLNLTETRPMDIQKFHIVFTLAGEVQTRWTNFLSYGEAMAAILDADMRIPLTWEYEITTTGGEI